MIKAIETAYAGRRFRSRTEARWAVFLDALGEPWEYEKEGFDLGDGVKYLPDFWLPRQSVWLEVKGAEPTPAEIDKARRLAAGRGRSVVIVSGEIGGEVVLVADHRSGRCHPMRPWGRCAACLLPTPLLDCPECGSVAGDAPDAVVRRAAGFALAARFEHGETARPAPPDAQATVYLAGKMLDNHGCDDGWRDQVATEVNCSCDGRAVRFFDPGKMDHEKSEMDSVGIVNLDLDMIDQADALLAVLSTDDQHGTVTEILHAAARRKPILVIHGADLPKQEGRPSPYWFPLAAAGIHHEPITVARDDWAAVAKLAIRLARVVHAGRCAR